MSTLQTYNLKHPDASGDQIVFTSGGDINFDNGAVYLDSANNRLGVGTSSPGELLDVAGSNPTLRIRATTSNTEVSTLRVTEDNNYVGAYFKYDGSTNLTHIGTHSAADSNAANDNNAIAIVRDTRFVGINTTSPGYLLDVNGIDIYLRGTSAYSGYSNIRLALDRARISGQLEASGGTPGASLQFYTMPTNGSVTERMRIDSGGDMLIGGTLPSSPNAEIKANGQIRCLNKPIPQSTTYLKYAAFGFNGQTLDVAAEIAAAVAGGATWSQAIVTLRGFDGGSVGYWHGIYSNGPAGGGVRATELANSGEVTLTVNGGNLTWPASNGTGQWYNTYITITLGSF